MSDSEERLDEEKAIERLNEALRHVIMRKQNQVDFLLRARRSS